MCSPCSVCYKYEDCGPPNAVGKSNEKSSKLEENEAKKSNQKENPLKRIKSRELRGGIMYYSCTCIKRNGLQHDCRRTGCLGEPECLVLPDPVCMPSQLARARGLAAPLVVPGSEPAKGGGFNNPIAKGGITSGKQDILDLLGVNTDASGKNECCCCYLLKSSKGGKGKELAGIPVIVLKMD